jgi:hypothetical protein
MCPACLAAMVACMRSRGLDALWGMWQLLDRAPKGRNETGHWRRRHGEYDSCCSLTCFAERRINLVRRGCGLLSWR